MAKAAPKDSEAPGTKGGSRKKLLLLAVPVLLALAGGGAWFLGLVPGGSHGAAHAEAAGEAHAAAEKPAAPVPVYFDMPDLVANLNVQPGRRAAFIKLRSKLELAKADDAAAVQASLPRLQDLFNTYLREMRPDELRGSAGTQRLREELMARANLAVAPARITDVLFVELLVQ